MNITPLPIKEIKEKISGLPEIVAMKKAIENNPWHDHQSVYDHTMHVVKHLEKYTRNKLLIIAALFHDVAKPETLVLDKKTGYTTCINHEEIGSRKVKDIGKRIGLNKKEIIYLERVIACHGMTHEMVNDIVRKKTDEPYAGEFFKKNTDIFYDLLLLALADTEGGTMTDSDPKRLRLRTEILKRLIKRQR